VAVIIEREVLMKRSLLVSAALLILLPDIASAQADRAQRDRPPQGQSVPGRPSGDRQNGPSRPAPGPVRPTTRPTPPHVRPVGPPQSSRPQPGRPQPGRPSRPPVHRPGVGRPPHFRPIHRPPFHYPSGYRYRRWSIGLILPRTFLRAPYYYDDYWALGVGAPPPGMRWVRYGPDLLLVDIVTGRIRDVIYGAFI